MNATTRTVSVNGPHGVHSTTVPMECPTEKALRSLGHYFLAAHARAHPLAAQVLAEKQAKQAAYDVQEAAKAAKQASKPLVPKTKSAKAKEDRTPVKAPAPSSLDASQTNPGVSTTVSYTTLATATQAQLIVALMSTVTTVEAVRNLVDAIDAALDAKEAAIEAADLTKATTPAPTVATPTPVAMAAKATDAPTAMPTANADERFGGKGGHTELRKAIQLHEGLEKMPQGTRECLLARLDAPAKAVLKLAEQSPKSEKTAAATVNPDPIVPGLFDAAGKPMTLSAVWAKVDAMTAKKAA